MKKIVVAVLLLTIIVFEVSGCMAKGSKSINEQALEYMEKKYGEPFTYAGPTGDSMSGTHMLKVTCASLTGTIIVEVENYQKKDRVFLDNYIAVKYKAETEAFLQECAEAEFRDARVFYDVREKGLSENVPADASFDQFLADARYPLSLLIEIGESGFTSREQAAAMAERIATSAASFSIMMVVMPDNEYKVYDIAALQEKMVKDEFIDCARINKLDGDIQLSWIEKES